MPKLSHSPHSLCLYIAEHTHLEPKIDKLSAANQNRARKSLILRQPIRIEYYVTRVVSQSESTITSPKSSANQNRVLRHMGTLS